MDTIPARDHDSTIAVAPRYATYIAREYTILGGEPVVKGTRIPVRSIVRAFEIYGDRGRVLQAFPSLKPEQVDAAMRFYQHNPELIRQYIDENEAAAFAGD